MRHPTSKAPEVLPVFCVGISLSRKEMCRRRSRHEKTSFSFSYVFPCVYLKQTTKVCFRSRFEGTDGWTRTNVAKIGYRLDYRYRATGLPNTGSGQGRRLNIYGVLLQDGDPSRDKSPTIYTWLFYELFTREYLFYPLHQT